MNNLYNDIKNCTKCGLYKERSKHYKPPIHNIEAHDVMMIGSAPNSAGEILSKSIVGPQETIIKKLITDLKEFTDFEPSIYITNMIFCRPTDKDNEKREPLPNEICNCSKFILRLFKQINPLVVIFVGTLAEEYYKKEFTNNYTIYHPNYLLKTGGLQSPSYVHCLQILLEAFQEVEQLKND